MFCKDCGAQMEDEAQFCPSCGARDAKLRAMEAGAFAPTVPFPPRLAGQQQGTPYPQTALPLPSRKGMTALLVLSIAALVVYAIWIIYGVSGDLITPDLFVVFGEDLRFFLLFMYLILFLFVCPFTQCILALVKSVQQKKTEIVVMSIIAVLFGVGLAIKVIGAFLTNASGFEGLSNSPSPTGLLFGLFILLYQVTFCIVSLRWCIQWRKNNTKAMRGDDGMISNNDIGKTIKDDRTQEERIVLFTEEGQDSDIQESLVLSRKSGEVEEITRYGSNKSDDQ
jgi:hypothetical protein